MMGTLSLQLLLAITLATGSGVVEVQRNNAWISITPGQLINIGERVRTGNSSAAALEMGPGKFITLAEGTEVQLRDSVVQLESGNLRVFSATNIAVAAKGTILESVEAPIDMQVGFQADRLNLMVFSGAVKEGALIIRGMQDSSVRTYTANGRSLFRGAANGPPMYLYIYPYLSTR